MDGLEHTRAALYATGMVSSIIVAGMVLRIKHWMARMLALVMFGWAAHCLLVLSYVILVSYAIGQSGYDLEFPGWHMTLRNIDALLLAGAPVAMGIGLFWERHNGNHRT